MGHYHSIEYLSNEAIATILDLLIARLDDRLQVTLHAVDRAGHAMGDHQADAHHDR